jgi:Ca2+-binding RTX toxin-like protein
LTASEQPVAGSTELIFVPRSDGTKLAIERRPSLGRCDAGLSGVWVPLVGSAYTGNFGTDDTQLLDMTPNTRGVFTDGNLAAGQSFTDAANNITIKTLSDTTCAPTASVQVCVGSCGTPPPQPTTTSTSTSTSPSSSTTTTKPTTTATTTKPTTTTTRPPTPPPSAVMVRGENGIVSITGTSGNDVIRAWRSRNHRVSVTANSPITLGIGCALVDAVVTSNGDAISLDGGAGNDTLTVDGSVKSTINGGDGNDLMVGGRAADVFIGGLGLDTVSYGSRTGETITATPGTGPDDGRRREKDDIRGDVEQVVMPASVR